MSTTSLAVFLSSIVLLQVLLSRAQTQCLDGEVQFIGSSFMMEGRVEICFNDTWYGVCGDDWDQSEASVVCRQQGYSPQNAVIARHFGEGTRPLLSGKIGCNGSEANLTECLFSQHSSLNQCHREAAVQCEPPCISAGYTSCNQCPTATDCEIPLVSESCYCNSACFEFQDCCRDIFQLQDCFDTGCNDTDVRIVGGASEMEGRVEICFFGGVWGSVCDDDWDDIDASVVCRQLGLAEFGVAILEFGGGVGPIYLDEVECTGTEVRLSDCSRITDHNCFHLEDAGVTCYEGCNDTDVRIVGGASEMEGRVEICFGGVWGSVCDDDWDDIDASVVCRQLGLAEFGVAILEFGGGVGPIYLDEVECTGTEVGLSDCSRITDHNCFHVEDAGVICYEDTGCNDTDIRIVGGASEMEGRVEICFGGVWGTVCDDDWDDRDAGVVCRELGFTEGSISQFGGGEGVIFLDMIACTGNEAQLGDCSHSGLQNHDCVHAEDAGVVCQDTGCNDTDVRIVGGASEMEGRVEICFGRVWGTVCDDDWDDIDASVVCRQLGFAEYGVAILEFGGGVGPIYLDEVECTGTEVRLGDCSRTTFLNFCSHFKDAGVTCYEASQCTDGDVRLVDGTSERNGRVEICFGGVWGTVCDDDWDDRDAGVVCRELGFTDSEGSVYAISQFGGGEGVIFLDMIACTGNEAQLGDCSHSGLQNHDCVHIEDAGVVCQEMRCNDTDVRIVGGASEMEGRVEICFGGVWGTVCDDGWGDIDASVVCRQLGFAEYGVALVAFGGGVGPIYLGEVECTGTEVGLGDCSRTTFPGFCSHFKDAGVTCYEASQCTDGDVRLVDGTSERNGRVEICFGGVWGTVCDDDWDDIDASVVCRQLGFTDGAAYAISQFGGGEGVIFLDMIGCTGNEAQLGDCSHSGLQNHDCVHTEDAGVTCFEDTGCTDGDVRLVDGTSERNGRVEICFRGVWGTVCDDDWDDSDAGVVCRQLGFAEFGVAILEFGGGVGPIYLDEVECTGTEVRLSDCSRITDHDCIHSEDAGVICYEASQCTDGDVRLVDGTSERNGRVEICFRGVWGTVCDDDWDNRNAGVVCRQLGFTEDAVATHLSHFGGGVGPTFLSSVNCIGTEIELLDCVHTNSTGTICEDAGAICGMEDVPMCKDNEGGNVQVIQDVERFGNCEPYMGLSDTCSKFFTKDVDFIYISKSSELTQAEIARELDSATALTISVASQSCQDLIATLLCHYYFIPCGTNDTQTVPVTVCPDECTRVITTCNNVWTTVLLGSELGLVDCSKPAEAVQPLPSCCSGFGIKDLPVSDLSTSESSKASPEVIVGGALGGALALVLVVLVVIVMVITITMKRKKSAVYQLQLETLRPVAPTSHGNVENGGACGVDGKAEASPARNETTFSNPYSKQFSSSLQRGVEYPQMNRVSSSYIRQLTGQMLFPAHCIEVRNCVGQGEFGIVYMAHLVQPKGGRNHRKTVAVKTLKGFFDKSEINKIMDESLKMKQFSHRNVLSLIGVCLDAGPAPYIIMPYMANGSLLAFLKKERKSLVLSESTDLDEDVALDVKKRLTVMCNQIASGMEYLAKEKFVHRDLATRNCMIDLHFVIKIADFGLSEDVYAKSYFRQDDNSVKLPVKWMAPESLQDGIFSEKTDVWSFGVTCWEVFSGGKMPYPGVDPLSLIQLLENGQRLNKPANAACPDEIFTLMLQCWHSDSEERPTFSALASSMSSFIETVAGYLDINFNPFGADIDIMQEIEGESSDHEESDNEEREVTPEGGRSPVIKIRVECPSDEET